MSSFLGRPSWCFHNQKHEHKRPKYGSLSNPNGSLSGIALFQHVTWPLFARKELNQSLRAPSTVTPRGDNLSKRIFWLKLTVLKALFKSTKTTPLTEPVSRAWRIWSVDYADAVIVEDLGLNPKSLGVIKFCSWRKDRRCPWTALTKHS